MAAVFDIVIPFLAGISILIAVYFGWKAFDSRISASRQAYDVGRQEARQSGQLNLLRSGMAFVVALVLLGVLAIRPLFFESAALPAEPTPVSTALPATALPTATTALTPTTEATATLPVPTGTPTPEPTPTSTPAPTTAVVRSGVGVWLRSAPGLNSEQVEWLLDETVVVLLDRRETVDDFEWQEVRLADGNTGWVAVDYLVPVEQ